MRKFKKSVLFALSFLLLTVSVLIVLPTEASASCHWVNGYTRKGKHVNGYWRDCGSSGGGSSSTTTTTTTTSYGTYYGTSNHVNLYRGQNNVGTVESSKLVYVEGYYRTDGTYVRPHYRTHPNNYIEDNFSSQNLSTLLPLKKYPTYKYSTNQNLATIEKYLLYSNGDYTFNNNQLTLLGNYASLLYEMQSKPEIKNIVKEVGNGFYQTILTDKLVVASKVKFDIEGQLTLEDYLLQVIYNSKYKSSLNELNIIIPVYAYYLRQAKEDLTKVNEAKLAGSQFYSLVGSYGIDGINQVEMDLLQNFKLTDERSISTVNTLKFEGTHNYDSIVAYLTEVGKNYNIIFNSLDLISYKIDLYFVNQYLSYSMIKSAIEDGKKLYIKYGLSSEIAQSQTEKDILVYLGSLIGNK